jgi:hypothetical protein
MDQQGLGQGGMDGAADQAELIAARLRETADQRAAMAQTEINRLQNHIQQLQQRMDELAKMKLPPGNLSSDLQDAHQRLEDAEADLDRANEAKQNTVLTSSLRQEGHEPSVHVDHTTHQGHGQGSGAAGPQKVGAVLGHSGAQTKQGISGPKRRL